MAIGTVTSLQAAAGYPKSTPTGAGILVSRYGQYTVSAAVADGDIIQMVWVPKGCTVVGGLVFSADMDSGIEAIDWMVGWAANGDEVADPNGFVLAGVKTTTSLAPVPFAGVLTTEGPKTFNAHTLIQVEYNAAAATFVAGQITVRVDYVTP